MILITYLNLEAVCHLFIRVKYKYYIIFFTYFQICIYNQSWRLVAQLKIMTVTIELRNNVSNQKNYDCTLVLNIPPWPVKPIDKKKVVDVTSLFKICSTIRSRVVWRPYRSFNARTTQLKNHDFWVKTMQKIVVMRATI